MFGLQPFRRKAPDVRSGAIFRRNGPGDLVETAKVIQVEPDALGIPHVSFDVKIEKVKDDKSTFKARRTLNLDTFANIFSEPVKA